MPADLWSVLIWPMLRLLGGICIGIFVANLLEGLQWTQKLACLARPLARLAHLHPVSAGAFTVAFVSPAAANGLLSDAWGKGKISARELVLANLFNSFPAYLVHLPSLFFLVWPVLGAPAAIYVGCSLAAALGRTIFTVILGHVLLNIPQAIPAESSSTYQPAEKSGKANFGAIFMKAWRSFAKRLPKVCIYTIPVFILMYLLQMWGFFGQAEDFLGRYLGFLSFLKPQAMGIIIFHMTAEFGVALGAAGSLLQMGALTARDIVIALLVGNILSTPMRAIRHQLPAYAGYYQPRMALMLVLANQIFRAASMALVTVIYIVL